MNLNETPTREKYKEFYGNNIEQMALLVKDNRVPMSMKNIIERRLNSKQEDWKTNYFDTCDAIVYGGKGKFKIRVGSGNLFWMDSETELEYGSIPINKEEYDNFGEPEYSEDTPKEVIWKELIGEHYDAYVKMLGYCPDFCISSSDSYCIRAWFVSRLEDRSNANGRDDLDCDDGRFVGIASEMLDSQEPSSNQSIVETKETFIENKVDEDEQIESILDELEDNGCSCGCHNRTGQGWTGCDDCYEYHNEFDLPGSEEAGGKR